MIYSLGIGLVVHAKSLAITLTYNNTNYWIEAQPKLKAGKNPAWERLLYS